MGMQISNTNSNYRYDDPVWYFYAEFSLSDFLLEHDRRDQLTAGLLPQAVRELGIPVEYVNNIEETLAELANEVPVHFKQGRLEIPGRVRVFCQKKIVDHANSASAASQNDHTEQEMEQAQMIYHSDAKVIGGWGYFLIERGGIRYPTGSTVSLWNSIDLYLYKEGE